MRAVRHTDPTPTATLTRCRSHSPRGHGAGRRQPPPGRCPPPLLAQTPVEEAVLRDVLIGESEQLERPRHGDTGHGDELPLGVELHAEDQMSRIPQAT